MALHEALVLELTAGAVLGSVSPRSGAVERGGEGLRHRSEPYPAPARVQAPVSSRLFEIERQPVRARHCTRNDLESRSDLC
jgi:hypothetical protein